MYWVIQENFYRERNHSLLVSALQTLDIPYEEVQLENILTADGAEIKERAIAKGQTSMVACGSTHLLAYATAHGWEPASFLNENFSYESWLGVYGENFLNYDSVVDSLSTISIPKGKFFVRPMRDNKAFDGQVLTSEEFEPLRDALLFCTPDLKVVISTCKDIFAEYRFFVVDGVIVTASQYRQGGKPFLTSDIDPATLEFAKSMVKLWTPARAYVLDVALTAEGYKVVELNSITSSGFYASDVLKLVDALDNLG